MPHSNPAGDAQVENACKHKEPDSASQSTSCLTYEDCARSLTMPVRTVPGHYYSPIPSREEVSEVVTRIRAEQTGRSEPAGIRLNGDKQRDLLKAFETFYKDLPFQEEQSDSCRYYFRQSPYPYPDAIFLYSFLRHVQPKQIIEVGIRIFIRRHLGYGGALLSSATQTDVHRALPGHSHTTR